MVVGVSGRSGSLDSNAHAATDRFAGPELSRVSGKSDSGARAGGANGPPAPQPDISAADPPARDADSERSGPALSGLGSGRRGPSWRRGDPRPEPSHGSRVLGTARPDIAAPRDPAWGAGSF